jgi:tol-pal system protein YbgF
MALLSVLVAMGCGLDHTGRSASYLMEARVDANKVRARSLERDLQLERTRVDEIEDRAANARRLLADSGATFETFLAEMQRLRGEVAELRHTLEQGDKLADDVDFRLTTLEVTIAHVMQELDVAPPSMLGITYSGDSGLGTMEDAVPDDEVEPAGDSTPEEVEGPGSTAETAATGSEEARAWTRDVGTDLPGGGDATKEDSEFGAALVEFKKGRWEGAGSRLQKFVTRYPDGRWYLQAQFLVGECLFELGRYKPAITEFQHVIERDEESQWAARAMFMQGMAFQALGTEEDIDAAKVFFSELVRLYPERPEAERAQARLEGLDAE